MRIVIARRTSQTFFLLLFLWFCVVATLGTAWFQLRGWPVNWFLELDPLLALGLALTTGTVYAGLLWALVTVTLTIVLGRAFCGWVCPFGAMHQAIGWLARRGRPLDKRLAVNQPQRGRVIKYYILFFMLSAATGTLLGRMLSLPVEQPLAAMVLAIVLAGSLAWLTARKFFKKPGPAWLALGLACVVWAGLSLWWPLGGAMAAGLQTGLLDPIPLAYRSINLVLLPWADAGAHELSSATRVYEGAWFIGALFLAALLLNLWRPRFYCRFVCPLGALLGLLGRFALWRIGKQESECLDCNLCERDCEGACEPTGQLIHSECVLCMNCREGCVHDQVVFSTAKSAAGERPLPDLGRRAVTASLVSGVAVIPMVRLAGGLDVNRPPEVVRPPGALDEERFLERCTKCGQCMRICPTNVIQPAWLQAGLEGIWTPMLNFRAGTSGCQINCVACGHLCPTAAIRPLSPAMRMGTGKFASQGPVRMGMAFVDRGRCLPWAMDRPCIVCQENCPVSPKAIYTRVQYNTVRYGARKVLAIEQGQVRLDGPRLKPGRLATGDYFALSALKGTMIRLPITSNDQSSVTLRGDTSAIAKGVALNIQVRLQQPWVDPKLCVGCGVCQHECPVQGRAAIRVTVENQTRTGKRAFI